MKNKYAFKAPPHRTDVGAWVVWGTGYDSILVGWLAVVAAAAAGKTNVAFQMSIEIEIVL